MRLGRVAGGESHGTNHGGEGHHQSTHEGLLALWSELRHTLSAQMGALSLPSWVDPDAMSALLVAVANGLVLQVTVDPSGPSLDAMAAQFGGLLLGARA